MLDFLDYNLWQRVKPAAAADKPAAYRHEEVMSFPEIAVEAN